MGDTSRDPKDLHPLLREAWDHLRADFEQRFPGGPKPRLSATYRGPKDQQRAFESGRSRVRYGHSLHNFKPAYAFDIFFDNGDGTANWDWEHFEAFAQEAKRIGLEWGGDWPGLRDGPHFQFLAATPAHARDGVIPMPPNVPKGGWLLVLMVNGETVQTVPMQGESNVVTRSAPERRRYYVDVRSVDDA